MPAFVQANYTPAKFVADALAPKPARVVMKPSKHGVELPPSPRADLKIHRLAQELGFATGNILLGHLRNELAHCQSKHYWKAVSQFYAYCHKK